MTKNKSKLNFPTILTLARIILTIPLFILIFCDCLPAKIIAIICFVVASITDYIDGKLARKNKQVTDLGAFLDPLADKMLINLTLLALCYQNLVPIWMFAIIIVRDFAVDGIRMMAAKKGITVSASKSGKLKTTVQMIALSLVLANKIFMNDILLNINIVLLSLMLLLTVVSGLEYIIKGWKLVIK